MGWDLDILVKWPDDPTGRTYVAVSSTSPKENSKVSADRRLFPSPGDECFPSRTLRERLAPRSFPRLLLVSTYMYIPAPSPARHLHISIYYFQTKTLTQTANGEKKGTNDPSTPPTGPISTTAST